MAARQDGVVAIRRRPTLRMCAGIMLAARRPRSRISRRRSRVSAPPRRRRWRCNNHVEARTLRGCMPNRPAALMGQLSPPSGCAKEAGQSRLESAGAVITSIEVRCRDERNPLHGLPAEVKGQLQEGPGLRPARWRHSGRALFARGWMFELGMASAAWLFAAAVN